MTGSSSDTAVFTAGENGTLSIVTTDAGGAAANITITADGTAELAGTTVTLNSSGGITLDADSGTITFADGGSSLGTITSSGFTGNVVGDVTGNTSGSSGSCTGNAVTATALATSKNINGVAFDGTGNITITAAGSTLSDTVTVAKGGTGATSFADKSVIITQDTGTDTLSAVAMSTNGQLLIGGTSGPAVGTLTAGSNITITNADGAITIAASGGGSVSGDTFATDLKIGRDSDNNIDFTTDNKIVLETEGNIDLYTKGSGANYIKLKYLTSGETPTITEYAHFKRDSSNNDLIVKTLISNSDIIFNGIDGGSDITALTLDMSDAGSATFNDKITSGAGLVIANNGTIGSVNTPGAITIRPGGAVAFAQAPSITGGLPITELDIDGGTDIGADLVDADLIIVDDGANGTNRKCALSRLKTYIGSGRTIVSSSVEFTSSSSSIQTSNITIPADSLIVTVRMIVTETLQLSGFSDVELNVGTNSSSYNNIINGSYDLVGFGVTSVSAGNVHFNNVMSGTDGAYIENQTNVRINLQSSSGNFTDGTVKFILEYITMS